jgi:hypothetical protein
MINKKRVLLLFLICVFGASQTIFAAQVSGSIYDVDGRIGIGTANPAYTLDVSGWARIKGHFLVNNDLQTATIRGNGIAGTKIVNSQGNIVGQLAPRSSGSSGSGPILVHDDFNLMLGSGKDYSIAYRTTEDSLVFSKGVDFATPLLTLNEQEARFIRSDGGGGNYLSIYSNSRGSFLKTDGGSDKGLFIINNYGGTATDGAAGNILFKNKDIAGILQERLVIDRLGRVGIGTRPTQKLTVAGSIEATDIVLSIVSWADFVFEPNYALMPIKEFGSFINRERHLPHIPSETDLKKEKVSIRNLQKNIVQTMEEYGLYIVALKAEVDRLHQRILVLENK